MAAGTITKYVSTRPFRPHATNFFSPWNKIVGGIMARKCRLLFKQTFVARIGEKQKKVYKKMYFFLKKSGTVKKKKKDRAYTHLYFSLISNIITFFPLSLSLFSTF